jgi:hypothetical protein
MNIIGNHNDEDELSRKLAALRVNAPQDKFMSSLHLRLVAAGSPQPQGAWERVAAWFAAHPAFGWPTLGAATGVAAFSLLFAFVPRTSGEIVPGHADKLTAQTETRTPPAARSVVVATYSVPSKKVALIQMNFTADVSVQDVTFEVALPPGLVFWSRGEALAEQVFRWPGSLEAGDNVVPVAVRGSKPGLYRVKAKAEVLDQVIEHEVVLQVVGPT